jgi:hypothetical protein
LALLARGSAACWLPCVVACWLYYTHYARAGYWQAAAAYFAPHWQEQLAASRRFERVCHPLAATLNVIGLCSSAWGRTLVWRGIRYAWLPDGTLKVVSQRREAAPAVLHLPQANRVKRPQRRAA